MKKTVSILAAAAITLTGMASTAGAMPLTPAPAPARSDVSPLVSEVQYRNGWRGNGYRNGYYRNGYRNGYGPGYYRQRNNNTGAAVAAGVIGGLALGAAAAAAANANSNAGPPPGGNDWLAYCSSRYRSFDPASGTYLGYDGRRHACQ